MKKRIYTLILFLIILSKLVYSLDFSTYEHQELKFYFPKPDSSFVRSLASNIDEEFLALKQILNHSFKNKIKIFFPDSKSDYDRLSGGHLPEWSGAVAFSQDRIIIIKPQEFKDNNRLLITLKHELVHIILADKYRDINIPLWLNEGLATYLSDFSVDLNSSLVISNAIAANKVLELKEINQLMLLNRASANLAYLEARIAVEFLVSQIGINNLADFLDDLNSSQDADLVFKKYLAYDLIDFEFYWYNYLTDKYKWMIILNFENLFWILLILIAVIAFITIKIRNYKKIKNWHDDELTELTEEN